MTNDKWEEQVREDFHKEFEIDQFSLDYLKENGTYDSISEDDKWGAYLTRAKKDKAEIEKLKSRIEPYLNCVCDCKCGRIMNNQVVITFDNPDQAERYFKRFNGINGANKIELGNKDLEKRDKLLEQAKPAVEQKLADARYESNDAEKDIQELEQWLNDFNDLKKEGK